MPNYPICTNTRKYNELVEALNNRGIQFETTHCDNKCFKCRTRVMIKEDDKYIYATDVKNLLRKMSIS